MMKCVICLENLKSHQGTTTMNFYGTETNWSQRCISCKDSWVCGSCYHNWDTNHSDTSTCYKTMPCVICKRDMIYSNFVNSFNEGTGVGWWDDIDEWTPLWDMLDRNMNM